eukprot:jgi/Psemu1/21469/gm1.21469_g
MEFSLSAKEESTTVYHSPSQYGLTLTKNGPIVPSVAVAAAHTNKASSNETFNSVLNKDNSNNDNMVIHEEICLPIQNDNGMDAAEPTAYQPNINERKQLIRSRVSFSPTNRLIAEIKLMNLMTKHKLPLNTFKSIFQWANKCQNIHGVDFSTTFPRHREAIFSEIKSNLGISETKFEPHIINLLPGNLPTQIFTPLYPKNNPPITNETYITELHHGSWWTESWKQICNENEEILVLIIFYMDGISLDAHGRLSLTPLNMTLGIFNVEGRKQPDAWTTIYFHPDTEIESIRHTKKPTVKDNIQNLHTPLAAALQSFKQVCEMQGGLEWGYLPYAGKVFKVKMKFVIAYVVGDTELHDKLCGKYGSYTEKVKKLCRHCTCPTHVIHKPKAQVEEQTQLWVPEDFEPLPNISAREDKEYFKSISHHPIKNAFHSLNFGCNVNNIHFATPSECLHMHQLGVARTIGSLAQLYGGLLSRQLDQDFPRTKFSSQLLSITKKEGNDYSGMLISILITLCSNVAINIIQDATFIQKQVEVIELILSMEEFLKHGNITISGLENLPKMIIHFINCINSTCLREGMDTKLIKNHLYFHLVEYIKLWGLPCGWDSSYLESHHKTEIKALSKNTQQNASTLIMQTAKRQEEKMLLRVATSKFNFVMTEDVSGNQIPPKVSGSKFHVFINDDGTSTMRWVRSSNKTKPHNNGNGSVSDDNCFSPNDDNDAKGICSKVPPLLSVDREGNNMPVDDSPPDSNMAIMTTDTGRHVLSGKVKVKIRLMKIMKNHSIPLVVEKELYERAIKSERLNLFSWTKGNLIQMRSRIMKDIYATVPEIEGNGFEPHLIDWCYKKLISLHSLLTNIMLVKEESLSFPHAEDPTLPVRYPELQGNIDVDELRRGQWWIDTCNKRCKTDSNENFDAWETIYFHPTITCDKGDGLIDNVNNLHSGLRVALSSLKAALQLSKVLGNNACVNVSKVPISIKSGKMKVSKDNSGEDESNHKTEVKAPAKRTQQIKSTIVKQTYKQLMEHDNYHGMKLLFHPHPSFKSNSGQVTNAWYDWANFSTRPHGWTWTAGLSISVSGFELVHNDYYAVACCFVSVDRISSKREKEKKTARRW